MASGTRFGQFLNKNWVLRADFECQYPRRRKAGRIANTRGAGKAGRTATQINQKTY